MRLIKVTGGLGNQMFIYAMFISMKKKFPRTKLDISDMLHYHVHYGYEMNEVFNLPKEEFCIWWRLKKILEILFFKVIIERKQNGSMKPYISRYLWPFVYFKGFYQSERYFLDVQNEVRRLFSFDFKRASIKTLLLLEDLKKEENSVSLHVRRGDYLQKKHWDAIGCVCQETYYNRAVKEMRKHVQNPKFYVFSEDLDWVKNNLNLGKAVYVDWNKGKDSWQDMMLMSLCHHHIICNSTFSWWGAWLGTYSKKVVIGPQKWSDKMNSSEVMPKSWIKVSVD